MPSFNDIKKGDKVATRTRSAYFGYHLTVYEVVRITPKQFEAVKIGGTAKIRVQKTNGNIIGHDETALKFTDEIERELQEQEDDELLRRKREYIKKRLPYLTKSQIERVFTIVREKQ